MAKCVIEFDTKAKTLNVSLDGKKIKDIAQVSIYNYKNYDNKEEAHIELTSIVPNEEEGIIERRCIYAAENIVETKDKIMMPHKYTELSKKLGKAMGLKND